MAPPHTHFLLVLEWFIVEYMDTKGGFPLFAMFCV